MTVDLDAARGLASYLARTPMIGSTAPSEAADTIRALADEVERLRTAARAFLTKAEHGTGCTVRSGLEFSCDCGRDSLVEALREEADDE